MNTQEVPSSQQNVDSDMSEQADDMLHESKEATAVDNHVDGDMAPDSSKDVTMVDSSATVTNGNPTP